MAHSERTPARAQRLTSAAAVLAVAFTSALAFARVFLGRGPTWKLLAAALASAAIAVAFERRSLLLATLISAAACLIAVTLIVFPASAWFGLPTPNTLHLALVAAGRIGQEAKIQVAPTQPLAPLMLAGVAAVWAAVFSMHALAVRTGSPMLGLLPPISLLAFADSVLEETVKPQYGVFFLVAALALVFADGRRRVQGWGVVWGLPDRGSRKGRWSMGSGARRMGLACVAAAILAPVVLPGFGSRAVIDLSSSTGAGLSPLVSIRAQLDRATPIELFRVQSSLPAYWRTVALDSFDGTTWRPEPSQDPVPLQPEISLVAPGLSPNVAIKQQFQQHFTVTGDLGSQWLPAAYPPSSVTSDTPFRYDTSSLSLSADGPLRTGSSYEVTSTVIAPTPAELDAIVFPRPAQDLRYTELPQNLPGAIAELARTWTKGQPDDYRKILAIQDRLAETFTYDSTVAPRDDSLSMVDFLTVTQRGFCQQFASSMAVMLRTMGIPARVAVGFTPGTFAPGTDTRVVSTDNYHAWVEVLFPTYGWLAFEPTPGRSDPVAAEYAQPVAACVGSRCSGGQRPGQTPGTTGPPSGPSGGQRGSRRGPLSGTGGSTQPLGAETAAWIVYGWVTGVLALFVLLGWPLWRRIARALRRRGAGRHARARILATYRAFTERAAALGYPRAPGETIEEYRARLTAVLAPVGPALGNLTRITGEAAYGPLEPPPERGRDAEDAARSVISSIRDTRSLGQRLFGAYRPTRV